MDRTIKAECSFYLCNVLKSITVLSCNAFGPLSWPVLNYNSIVFAR